MNKKYGKEIDVRYINNYSELTRFIDSREKSDQHLFIDARSSSIVKLSIG